MFKKIKMLKIVLLQRQIKASQSIYMSLCSLPEFKTEVMEITEFFFSPKMHIKTQNLIIKMQMHKIVLRRTLNLLCTIPTLPSGQSIWSDGYTIPKNKHKDIKFHVVP